MGVHLIAAPIRMFIPPPFLLSIAAARMQGEAISLEAEQLVVHLFQTEGRSLVRLAWLFVDDRDAAEDLVQEAFLRLARHAGRIEAVERAPAYLRSIVLNLARDHNRRGSVSLRHHATGGREIDVGPDIAERLVDRRSISGYCDAVRQLPNRQRELHHASVLRGALDRIDRRDARLVAELGEDPSPAGNVRTRPTADRDMSELTLERRLIEAFADARASVEENPDLFARVAQSLEDATARRRFRWTVAGCIVSFITANAGLALTLSNSDNGRFNMPWWVIELITNIVLVALAIGLGPFIKRFGRSYAADVFRANPRTGKSYLVLTDVAYYLIFTSFVLFTVSFVEHNDWVVDRSTAESRGRPHRRDPADHGHPARGQRRGLAHHRRPAVQQQAARGRPSRPGSSPSTISVPPLGAGTWILRVEQAPRRCRRNRLPQNEPGDQLEQQQSQDDVRVIVTHRFMRHPSACAVNVNRVALTMVE